MKLFKNKFSSFISHFSSRRGFTLIELLIVIAILGILAAGVLVAINPVQKINQANDANMKSNVGQIATALQAYYTTNQKYPTVAEGLTQLVTAKELKVVPPLLTGYTSYNYAVNSAITDVSLSFILMAPVVTGTDLWCWQSSTGQAVAVTQSTGCAP